MAASPSAIRTDARAMPRTKAIAAATLVFGAALVYTVGFAQSATLHNAAHDTRHAIAFPCH